MLLLWQNNVPMSVEVLLCPDCRLGKQKARSVEFSTIPEPGSLLLEQVHRQSQIKPTIYINIMLLMLTVDDLGAYI
jgi:hypothetical protein